ncbi:MAG: hypothetical protein K2I47_03955 [Odoribacter sp.]|nr:hypothetical protein [Odoribacter sp.]
MENIMNERNERNESGQEISSQEECRSQSLGAQLRQEHAMNNDVELLHSEGDEPDLLKYLKERKSE